MRRQGTIVAVLFGAGLAASAASLLADSLGIDPSPGWGKLRMALLAAGVCSLLAGAMYWRFGAALDNLFDRFTTAARRRLGSEAHERAWKSSARYALREYWIAVPLVVFMIAVYAWYVTGGTWNNWVSPARYYADLARGFARGELYMAVRPDPGLLAAEDPWKPLPGEATAGPLDVSFYKGRFYLYWGPVPAMLLALARPVFPGRVGDLQLAFGFAAGLCVLQCALLMALWERWFKGCPKYLLWLSLLVTGLANPVSFVLNSYQGARIYEAAILGGQFFLVGGFLAAFGALGPPASPRKLALAGVLWGLAIGTRVNLAPVIGSLVLLAATWILGLKAGLRTRLLNVSALSLPLALSIAGLGWYNWARFGSVMETGLSYQLGGTMSMYDHRQELFSPLYVPQNLYNYLLNPVALRTEFPFLYALPATTKPILPSFPLPVMYRGQLLTGILFTAPFAVYAMVALCRRFLPGAGKDQSSMEGQDIEQRRWRWTVGALGTAALVSSGVLLLFWWSAMRYLEDVLPLLMALSVLGFWRGYQAVSQRGRSRRWYVVLGVALAGTSIVSSLLVAISINDVRLVLIRMISAAW